MVELRMQDEKMGKIVDEVDRFFRSVHAEVEDWKFAMEDDGDGTRIFVRFQVHIGSTQSSARPKPPSIEVSGAGGARIPEEEFAVRKGRPPSDAPPVPPLRSPSPEIDAAVSSDPDLAYFVDEWKHKRENRPHGEFHKAGAPLVEAPVSAAAHRRHRSDAART